MDRKNSEIEHVRSAERHVDTLTKALSSSREKFVLHRDFFEVVNTLCHKFNG